MKYKNRIGYKIIQIALNFNADTCEVLGFDLYEQYVF